MQKFAKIMPTLGPSSWSEEVIEQLVLAGANAFRLNFSHADAARHTQTAANVRAVAAKLGRHIPLLQDLQGPKIRIGNMAEPVQLVKDQLFVLDSSDTPGDATRVQLPHADIMASVQVGDVVSVNDGVIRLTVIEKADGSLTTRVANAGIISSRKGVNVPGRELPLEALTAKDLLDLQTGLELGVDWVALSFVQKAEDVVAARKLIGDKAHIMTKIETQAAVINLESIVEVSDAIMIARGDLGVELPAEDVPPLQRKMIELCRHAGKPVVVATQMLESMITNPVPTRAEASDVATAAYDGADCLMLSAESASGAYPVEAVSVMARIIEKVEQSDSWQLRMDAAASPEAEAGSVRDATTEAASYMAESLAAGALVSFTETGKTTLRMARWRPAVPHVCLTPHAGVARRMALVWGVQPIVVPPVYGTDEMVEASQQALHAAGLVHPGGRIVIAAGIPFGQSGGSNLIRVVEI